MIPVITSRLGRADAGTPDRLRALIKPPFPLPSVGPPRASLRANLLCAELLSKSQTLLTLIRRESRIGRVLTEQTGRKQPFGEVIAAFCCFALTVAPSFLSCLEAARDAQARARARAGPRRRRRALVSDMFTSAQYGDKKKKKKQRMLSKNG